MKRKKIAVVGVGLIGGSMAIQLHEKKLSSGLIGVDASAAHAQQALEMELVDEVLPLEQAIAASEVVILAVPVDQLVQQLPAILDLVKDQIVIDLEGVDPVLLAPFKGLAEPVLDKGESVGVIDWGRKLIIAEGRSEQVGKTPRAEALAKRG